MILYRRDVVKNCGISFILKKLLTSVTQSTEEGEENSNQILYKNGKAYEVRSGNNVVAYEYDCEGRITEVKLNGTEYLETKYSDVSGSNNDVITSKYVPRGTDNLSDIFEVTKNKNGDILEVKYGKANKAVDDPVLTEEYSCEYNEKFRIKKVTQGTAELENYEYRLGEGQAKTDVLFQAGKKSPRSV